MTKESPDRAVDVHYASAVATITLRRPDRLNAWNRDMDRQYFDALRVAAESDEVRAIVVTGAGRAFCAGADLFDSEMTGPVDGEPHVLPRRRSRMWYPLTIGKPVIAAVNGPCAGLGVVVAAMCDMRIVDPDAFFVSAYASRGLPGEHAITWILPRLVGMGRAFDMLASGRKVGAAEARDIGLANEVSPAGQARATATERARHLATMSSQSIEAMKLQLLRDASSDIRTADRLAEELQVACVASADLQEGIRSFRDGQPPSFVPPSESVLRRMPIDPPRP